MGVGRMTLYLYIHLLEGLPAFFDGEQLVYAGNSSNDYVRELAFSVHQIRKEQKISRKFRLHTFQEDKPQGMGYVKVMIPPEITA